MNKHTIDFRYAPPSRWTCIGLPDDEHKSLVREDGALLYRYARNLFSHGFERVLAFGPLTDQPPMRIEQTTETARRAIVVTKIVHRWGHLALRTFAVREGDVAHDVVRWRIEVAEVKSKHLMGMWISAVDQRGAFEPEDEAEGINSHFSRVRFRASCSPQQEWQAQANTEPAWVSVGHRLLRHGTCGYGPGFGCVCMPVPLCAGQSMQGAIVIPLGKANVGVADLDWVDRKADEARQFWDGHPIQRRMFQTPDEDLDDVSLSCARNILQAREFKDGVPEFQVGPTCYRGLWMVDGHFLLEAARYLGHDEDADRGLEAVLRRVRDDGSITEMEAHTKETGIAIATIVRQTELSGRWDHLSTLWPIVQNALKYIQHLRAQSYELDPKAPEHRLMPASFPDGGIGGLRAEYTTALWTLAGLKSGARAAAFLNLDSDAEAFTNEFDGLMNDFRTHAQRDMRRTQDGTSYLPQVMPGTSSDHHWHPQHVGEVPVWQRLNPASGTWALCQSIYPGEVFEPSDPIVTNLLSLFEQIDGEQGIPAGTGWLPFGALWTYFASFAAHVWLYAGRSDKAVDYLYAFANHAAPTRVWREEQSLAASGAGLDWGDMPHNWGSAEFIRLMRHMLVFERGNGVELLPGFCDDWELLDRPLVIEGTPTRFGPIDLRFEPSGEGGYRLRIKRDPAWPIQPRHVRLYVPRAMRDRTLMINNSVVELAGDGIMRLPGASVEVTTCP